MDHHFVIWPHGEGRRNAFFNWLNSVNYEQISMEKKSNRGIAFHNDWIEHKAGGSFGNRVYCKYTTIPDRNKQYYRLSYVEVSTCLIIVT